MYNMNNGKYSKFTIAFCVVGVAFAAAALFVIGLHAVHAGTDLQSTQSPEFEEQARKTQGNPQSPSTLPDPGIYVFLDWYNLDPGQYPYVIGGHYAFIWNEIEPTQQGVYNWTTVDNWIAAQASLGKPVGIGFNAYDGQCCGGDRLPSWFKQQHPDGYVTCQGAVIPKYWSASFQQAWRSFVQAAAARYDSDPRVRWIETSSGIYGETTPAEPIFQACLQQNGLTSDGWVQTVNWVNDIYHQAWQNKPLFIQYAPFFMDRNERRQFTDYAASLGIGMKHNKLELDGDDRIIDDPSYFFYRAGQYDPMLTYADQLPMVWEAYREQFPTETDTYWGFFSALNKHPTYILVNRPLLTTATPLEQETFYFANRYLGRTRQDTPSVWTAMRETQYTWYPQYGNFDFWLYQNDSVPGGHSVPLWNATTDPRGRYARRTDQATGNPFLYFDVDDGYILGGTNVVNLTVTYLDQGIDSWRLEYDAVDNPFQVGLEVQKHNTGQWLTASVILPDATFANRQPAGAGQPGQDFRIYSNGDGDDVFHFVNVARLSSGQQVRVELQPNGAGYDGVTDTHISQWDVDTNYGDLDRFSVRPGDIWAGLIKFEIPQLPANATVSDAQLDLKVIGRSNESNWMDAQVFALRRPFTELEATWN